MLPEINEIQKRRKALSLTQNSLAAVTGVSQSIIAKVESGKVNPSYSTVKKLLDTLESMNNKNELKAIDIAHKKIIRISKNDNVSKAVRLMKEHGYSQLPVFDGKNIVGSISEKNIMNLIAKGQSLKKILGQKVEDVMSDAFPRVNEQTPAAAVSMLLQNENAVLVVKNDKTVGIITKADLLRVR